MEKTRRENCMRGFREGLSTFAGNYGRRPNVVLERGSRNISEIGVSLVKSWHIIKYIAEENTSTIA